MKPPRHALHLARASHRSTRSTSARTSPATTANVRRQPFHHDGALHRRHDGGRSGRLRAKLRQLGVAGDHLAQRLPGR
ncbi:MAG: hypothetical protein AABZ58_01920, partial [Chloroflexota bacterium]